jgi:hypothetical protein
MKEYKYYQVVLEIETMRKLQAKLGAETAKEALQRAVEFTIKNYGKVE